MRYARIARLRNAASIIFRTLSTDAISFSIERRGVSISTHPSCAFTVAARRRPEMSEISPKKLPVRSTIHRAPDVPPPTSMPTSPSTIE